MDYNDNINCLFLLNFTVLLTFFYGFVNLIVLFKIGKKIYTNVLSKLN